MHRTFNMNIELIPAIKTDAEKIAQMAADIWKAYYPEIITMEQIDYMLNKFYSKQALLEQIEAGQNFYLIKEDDIEYGFISISKKSENDYFIHKFYIYTNTQRRSIGSAIIEKLTKDISSQQTTVNFNLRLTVNRQNYKAINFYFKNQFRIESVEDFDIGNSYLMNDFVMVKHVKIDI